MDLASLSIKIRKLLALSDSPNEHEAALALQRVQEILDRYNLSIEELAPDTSSKKIETLEIVIGKERHPHWEFRLFSKLSRVFDCYPYVHTIRLGEKRERRLGVVGHNANVATFRAVYDRVREVVLRLSDDSVLRQSLSYAIKTEKQASQYRRSFRSGCVDRIVERVENSRKSRLDANDSSRALVVRHKEEVHAWVKGNMKISSTINTRVSLSRQGYIDGNLAGRTARIFEEIHTATQEA